MIKPLESIYLFGNGEDGFLIDCGDISAAFYRRRDRTLQVHWRGVDTPTHFDGDFAETAWEKIYEKVKGASK